MRYLPCALAAAALAFASLAGCARTDEVSLEDYEKLYRTGKNEILSKTVSKPWKGEEFLPGKVGGTLYGSITEDPKSFNLLVAERDSLTNRIVGFMHDSLLDYDYVKREFKPNCASASVAVNDKTGKMDVTFTLRDDLYWTFLDGRKIKVTSDDVVYWYDEIVGDPAFSSSQYNSQYQTLDDGTTARIAIERLDDRRFVFHCPCVIAEPFLTLDMTFGPKFLFEKAKKAGGAQGVLSLFGVDTKPADMPSMGMWLLKEYSQGQRLVFVRNPNYWKRDQVGNSIPYPEQRVIRIVPDHNTQLLLFKEGKVDTFAIGSDNLDDLVNNNKGEYTVFSGGASLSSVFWTFNQNPKHADDACASWFAKKEFRQAMSCLMNRQRIIDQAYRGLAEPSLTLFSPPNPYYDPTIVNKYTFDQARALKLLESIGMRRDASGTMRDSAGREVKFDLVIYTDSVQMGDTATILADECKKVGITLNVRSLDFQKIVEELTSTYNWESMLVALTGSIWPMSGDNVWLSSGNLHMWHPLQKKPATDWEARIDELFGRAKRTIDHDKAKKIWDEFQGIVLEQCPIIYTVSGYTFMSVRNRLDFTNVYYDSIGSLQDDHVYLRE